MAKEIKSKFNENGFNHKQESCIDACKIERMELVEFHNELVDSIEKENCFTNSQVVEQLFLLLKKGKEKELRIIAFLAMKGFNAVAEGMFSEMALSLFKKSPSEIEQTAKAMAQRVMNHPEAFPPGLVEESKRILQDDITISSILENAKSRTKNGKELRTKNGKEKESKKENKSK